MHLNPDWLSDDTFGPIALRQVVELDALRRQREQVASALRLAESIQNVMAHTSFRDYQKTLEDLLEVRYKGLLAATSEREASIAIGACRQLEEIVGLFNRGQTTVQELAQRLRMLDDELASKTPRTETNQ